MCWYQKHSPKSNFIFSFHKITISSNRNFILYLFYLLAIINMLLQRIKKFQVLLNLQQKNHLERLLKHKFPVTTLEILISRSGLGPHNFVFLTMWQANAVCTRDLTFSNILQVKLFFYFPIKEKLGSRHLNTFTLFVSPYITQDVRFCVCLFYICFKF